MVLVVLVEQWLLLMVLLSRMFVVLGELFFCNIFFNTVVCVEFHNMCCVLLIAVV